MSRFLFIVPPLHGHLNPTLSVGGELLNRGHKVAWVCNKSFIGELIPPEGEFIFINANQEEIERIAREEGAKKVNSTEFMFEQIWIPYSRITVKGISETIDQFKPDVIIHDNYVFSGAICAYRKNIPYATSITAPPELADKQVMPRISEKIDRYIIDLQKEFGINEQRKITDSEKLCLVFSSKEFIGMCDFPDYYKFVGPVIENRRFQPSFDWDKFNQSVMPKILVSLGTIDLGNRIVFFSKIAESFTGEYFTVIVVACPEILDRWPENFIVQDKIPQLDLLPHMDAVICHGGHNTVCEALSFSVPVIVAPMAFDQYKVASLVENSVCGRAIKFKRFTPSELRNILHEFMTDEKYKNAAKRIGDSFKNAGGAKRAAQLLEEIK
jgi:MGT family glycosyltransferase